MNRAPRSLLRLASVVAMAIAIAWGSISKASGGELCAAVFDQNPEKIHAPELTKTRELFETYERYSQSPNWWLSHTLYLQHLKAFGRFARDIEAIDEQSNPELNDPRFFKTIKKLILNPRDRLTTEELTLIAGEKAYRRVFEGIVHGLLIVEFQKRALERINLYWSTRAPFWQVPSEKTWKMKALRTLEDLYNGPVRFLSPLPLPRAQTEVDRIFERQFRSPQAKASPEELKLLEQKGALSAYLEKERFMNERPTWTLTRRWIQTVALGALIANTGLAINLGLHLGEPGGFVASDEFFENDAYRLGPNQVRLYNESVPFPHMAIEIDGKVYSYGQTHMRVRSAREYLLLEQINEALDERNNVVREQTMLDSALELTGLSHLSRSVQMVTLNLTLEEKARLKRELELSTGMAYRNHTLSLDCATMVVLALKASSDIPIPKAIDASPSGVMMFLGMLKTFGARNTQGEPLVGDIRQIAMAAKDRRQMHILRSIYINMLEGRVAISFFPFNTASRAYLDLRYGEKNFQYWNPEVRAEIESWQTSVREELAKSETGIQLDVFRERALELVATPPAARTADWNAQADEIRKFLNYVVDDQVNRTLAKTQSADTAFEDIVRSAFRHTLLEEARAEILAVLSGLPAAYRAPKPSQILDQVKRGEAPYGLQTK